MKPKALLSSPKLRRVMLVILAALLVGVVYIWWHAGEESTDDAAFEARLVALSPKVGGYVKTLYVVDNQPVKAGDKLLAIDTTDYQLRVDRTKAALEQAKAAASGAGFTLETARISAPSTVEASKAQVAAAEASWKKAASELARMQRLTEEARSREQLEAAEAAEQSARAMLEDAKARLRSAQTAPKTIATAKANHAELAARVKQAEVELAQAKKDLADTVLYAPMDGRVIKRNVEMGDYVTPGQKLGFLVGNDIWVVANFKETQLTHMRKGQKADIEVDAFPQLKLHGIVESIQRGTGSRFSAFPAENATGNFVKVVQRVPVKIIITDRLDNTLPLGPGMSVAPTVYTKE